uniref:BTB domain-containing protein n=1 Tax=Cacopsylla melanoneura TaxID=428564 RepID=A0A8D8Q983_9HEMI
MQLQQPQVQEHGQQPRIQHQQQRQQIFGDPILNPPESANPILSFTTHPSNIPQPTNDPNLSTNPTTSSLHSNPNPPTSDPNLSTNPAISSPHSNPNPLGNDPNQALLSIQPSNIPPTNDTNLSTNPAISSTHLNPNPPSSDPNLFPNAAISSHSNPNQPTNNANLSTNAAISSTHPNTIDPPHPISPPPNLIHFMIPYLLKDHPSFNRLLFGSDAILFRILSELEGPNQEEAVSCVEELLSGGTPSCKQRSSSGGSRFCRGKCAPRQVTYEGDLTFVLDDGTTLVTNRQLLIHKSLYFETMLCGNFKECDQKSAIKLSHISSACLSHLLKLIGSDSCTCALPRTNGTNVLIYLELIVKSDEYLLHELNYRLIQLLYGSSEVVNASNVHLVYEWSLRYSEFVQSCVTNYENYFSKTTTTNHGKESPSVVSSRSSSGDWTVTQGVKRVKLSDRSERNLEDSESGQRTADLGDKVYETSGEMEYNRDSTSGTGRDGKGKAVERNPPDREMNENAKREEETPNEKCKDRETPNERFTEGLSEWLSRILNFLVARNFNL